MKTESKPEPPKRRFELTLKLGADSRKDLLETMRSICIDLDRGSMHVTSGGYGSGFILDVVERPEITHETWEQELDEYLNRLNALNATTVMEVKP